ncbi:hypothetical protein ETB97_000895 [Aspergillus alliaceus]|uniref:Xylanolytic transcriptional activator regulatory domain-containing protein n=1 Tax=Petromyces alliaceus TaxID=209559 RepID=A0A8H6A5E3_PETAA|nr:hypothetical protein ETB97_000895 [Aspergillus burnettii]
MYMQDKWTALMHGRPSHIHDDNWGVKDITDSDLYDPGDNMITKNNEVPMNDIQTGRRGFVEMITLSKTLSKILTDFFSLRASKSQDTAELYHRALPVLEKLRLWRGNIPNTLLMDRQIPRRLCANGSLHLSYHSLVLTLLRRIIRSTALAPLCSDVAVLNDTRRLASDSAEAAMAFVRTLRPDHLEAFWFFSSGFSFSLVGSFVTLLLVTSRSEAEKAHWRERLNDYLWTLRIMGKGSEPMRYAVNRLEGAILRGMEHALAVRIAPELSEHIPSEQYGTFTTLPPQPSPQSSSANHQASDTNLGFHATIPSTSSHTPGDWLTPFLNEDLINLNLKHFDWLAGN